MACVNSDGTLMPSAIAILNAIKTNPLNVEELAKIVDQPLYKIRSGLREMLAAKLVEIKGDGYLATELGISKIDTA